MSVPGQLTYGVYTSRAFVGVGGTLALFVDVIPGQIYTTVQAGNGGTFEILPALSGTSLIAAAVAGSSQTMGYYQSTAGTTQSLAQLGNLSGTGYMVGGTGPLGFFNLNGPARFYVNALGATCLVLFAKHVGS